MNTKRQGSLGAILEASYHIFLLATPSSILPYTIFSFLSQRILFKINLESNTCHLKPVCPLEIQNGPWYRFSPLRDSQEISLYLSEIRLKLFPHSALKVSQSLRFYHIPKLRSINAIFYFIYRLGFQMVPSFLYHQIADLTGNGQASF